MSRWVIVGGLSWAVVGCSTPTKLEGVSSKAAAGGAGYRRPLVCGVGRSPEVRRRVEEAFKKELNDRGVDAVPSIDYVPETQQANEQMLATVVRGQQGGRNPVDAAGEGRAAGGRGRHRCAAGCGPAGRGEGVLRHLRLGVGRRVRPAQVYAVDDVVLETFLIDTRTSAVVWSGARGDGSDTGKAGRGGTWRSR